MYCELFGLRELPFRLTPDPQFLFASKQHARAKAYMESTIWLADGFVVITGDIGSGKTTLIESFLEELPEDVVLAHISQTQLSPVEFLQALLVELGFEPYDKRKIELLSMLKDFLVEQYAQQRKVLLIVDEAQNLSRKVLEEVRLLSGIEAQKEKLLRIVLAGQPELADKLNSPRLEQLTQRVRLRFHLSALSKRETREYIEHRLAVAGSGGRPIFDDGAFETVFRYAGGVPRLTNILCDTAMLVAYADEKNTIDTATVEMAIEELQWPEYAERAKARERHAARELDNTGRYQPQQSLGRFEVLFRDQFVADFNLSSGRAVIGRTPDNDLQIPSKFISKHHAQVITDAHGSVVEDLNSTNGVFVRSKRVARHQLMDGDVIQLGEHKLLYRDLRANGAATLDAADEAEDTLDGESTTAQDGDLDDEPSEALEERD